MNCPVRNTETSEVLLDYCAGKLTPEAAMELQRHIELCPECRAFSEAQSQVWRALDTWEAEPVSEGFDSRLYERIAESGLRRPSWRQWVANHLSWRPALSAAIASAAVAIAVFIHAPGNPSVAPTVQIENSRIDVIEPEQVERALEDLEMLNQLSPSQDL